MENQWIEKLKMTKKHKVTKNYYTLIFWILFVSCETTRGPLYITFPDGDVLECSSVNELEKSLNCGLLYEQYQGFTGKIKSDSILSRFTILFANHSRLVGFDIVSDSYIKGIKNKPIESVMFDKIPESVMSFKDVLNYVSKKYPLLMAEETKNTLKVGVDKELKFKNEDGETILRVQYSALGIKGSIVTLMAVKGDVLLRE